jgi:hypothetical protein
MHSLNNDLEILLEYKNSQPVHLWVDKARISDLSAFYRYAISVGWNEAQHQPIHIRPDDQMVFQVYVRFLNCGTIPAVFPYAGVFGGVPETAKYMQIIEAYLLGEKLHEDNFCDTMVDRFILTCHEAALGYGKFFGEDVIKYIYGNTPESSKLRRLLVDVYAYHAHGNWLPNGAAEFVHSVAAKALEDTQRDRRNEFVKNPVDLNHTCAYHRHGPDPKLCYERWDFYRWDYK